MSIGRLAGCCGSCNDIIMPAITGTTENDASGHRPLFSEPPPRSTAPNISRRVSSNRLSKRFSALPGSADRGQVHSATLWRHSSGLEYMHALLSISVAARIRICAFFEHDAKCAFASKSAWRASNFVRRGYDDLMGQVGIAVDSGAAWRPTPEDNPVLKILQLLFATVALPFFVLSTTGPLLQSWYSRGTHGNSPYRLYALSNAGSLLGLVEPPVPIE